MGKTCIRSISTPLPRLGSVQKVSLLFTPFIYTNSESLIHLYCLHIVNKLLQLKIVFFQVTLHATCFTLTALTIDRYHAIVNAVTSMNWRSRRTSTIVSLMVWAGTRSFCLCFSVVLTGHVILFRIHTSTRSKIRK